MGSAVRVLRMNFYCGAVTSTKELDGRLTIVALEDQPKLAGSTINSELATLFLLASAVDHQGFLLREYD